MIHGLEPRLAEAGKIKIGGLGESRESSRGQYRLPVKFDHFVLVGTERDDTGDLITDGATMTSLAKAGFADQDGRIRTIPVLVHSDDLEEVFRTALSAYAGNKLLCTGDGRQAQRVDKATGEVTAPECPCPWLDATKGQKCKPHGVFSCSINLPDRAVAGSVHRFRTTGRISIGQLLGSLIQIKDAVGAFRGLPLVLRVGPRTVSPDGKATTVYVVWAELRATSIAAAQQAAIAASETRQTLQLTSARSAAPEVVDTPIELSEVSGEFYPMPPVPAPGVTTDKTDAMEAMAAAATPAELDQDPEPEPEPAAEKPLETVTRLAKAQGATKEQIRAAIKLAKAEHGIPLRSPDWTDDHIGTVLDLIYKELPK